jgi:hypothetical protein
MRQLAAPVAAYYPKVLLTYVAEALNAVEPIDERVFDALASPGSSVPGSVVPRLGSVVARNHPARMSPGGPGGGEICSSESAAGREEP